MITLLCNCDHKIGINVSWHLNNYHTEVEIILESEVFNECLWRNEQTHFSVDSVCCISHVQEISSHVHNVFTYEHR